MSLATLKYYNNWNSYISGTNYKLTSPSIRINFNIHHHINIHIHIH